MQYKKLVEVYEKLGSTSKRLKKTKLISGLLKNTKEQELERITLLLQGRIFHGWEEEKIGVASRLIIKAINVATGIPTVQIEKEWKKTGGLGKTAENLVKKKKQATLFSRELSVDKVHSNIKKLAKIEGTGSVDIKLKLIAELLTSASPLEAKYIVRTILEDLRVGIGEGTLRDAICWTYFPGVYDKVQKNDIKETRGEYNKTLEIIQEALDLSNDFALVAITSKKKGLKGLEKISLTALSPLKVMLFQKAKNIEDAFDTVGKPAAFEYKYDGFRLQLHRDKDEIKLFTRRLDDVSSQFPDVMEVIKDHIKAKSFILDSEVIGIDPKSKKWLPFQNISQRIKRKYDIQTIKKTVPVMVNLFDAIMVNGKNLLKVDFKDRRKALEKITKESKNRLQLASQLVTDDRKKAEDFYAEALKKGNEGVMVKKLEAPYKPGSRVGYGVKVKPVMETLDLVIIGAEWGEGKRGKWLSSYRIACQEHGRLLEIGKVSTGMKEKPEEGTSFGEMTKLLKPLTTSESGKSVVVKPKIVIEVDYEEIQKSPTYSSGYALRFPRVVKLRPDKGVKDASEIDFIEQLYFSQRGR